MRSILASALTALSSANISMQMLVTMSFTSGTVRLATGRVNVLDFDSPPNTYTAIGNVGTIGAVEDKGDDTSNLTFTLSGVDTASIALALGEQVRGRPFSLEVAVMDAATRAVLDIVPMWAGHMSTMELEQQDGKATIKVTCEHRGVLFNRTRTYRYTDADQQKQFGGDRCLEYIVSQSQAKDVWPAASFFKQ